MKYSVMQKAMWAVYSGTFEKGLSTDLNESNPKGVMKRAKAKYKDILKGLPEFDKGDRFLVNILSCAMVAAVLLNVEKKYDVEQVRVYYRNAMCENKMTKLFATRDTAYTQKGRDKLKRQAKDSENRTNPYSWKFTVEDGKTMNQYTATFYTCGICKLMNDYGLSEYTPALCTLDYDMAAMNNTVFTREYTIAGGGKFCDCHYNHKSK